MLAKSVTKKSRKMLSGRRADAYVVVCVLLRVRGCLFDVFESVFVCWHARPEKIRFFRKWIERKRRNENKVCLSGAKLRGGWMYYVNINVNRCYLTKFW